LYLNAITESYAADATPDAATVGNVFSDEQEKAIEATGEKFEFQAEVNRLMDIIINSLCKSLDRNY
jgi:hypothetical protein